MINEIHGYNQERLDKIKVCFSSALSRELIDDTQVDLSSYIEGMITAQVRASFWGRNHDPRVVASYPADWWQAFKERWFPAWALNRWPIRFNKVVVNGASVFPELKFKTRGEEKLVVFVERKTE